MGCMAVSCTLAAKAGKYGTAVAEAKFSVQGEGMVAEMARKINTEAFRRDNLAILTTDMSVAYGRATTLAADMASFAATHACTVSR